MASYYSYPFWELNKLNNKRLSKMYSGMVANKAISRLHNIEDLSSIHMEKKTRDKFISSLYKKIDSSYSTKRPVEEDELKRILGNVGHKSSN